MPAVFAAGALAAGAAVAARADVHTARAIGPAIGVGSALAVPAIVNLVDALRGRPRRRRAMADLLVLVSLALAGASWYAVRHDRVAPSDIALLPGGSFVTCGARVLETRRASGRTRVFASIESLDDGHGMRPASGRVWTWWPREHPAPSRGDVVRLEGTREVPRGLRNPGGFDFSSYLRRRGGFSTLHLRRGDVVSEGRGASRLAGWIERGLEASLGGRTGALLTGLMLGRSGELPEETREAFRRSGTVHVLAVSGLHVGFVVLIALSLLRSARLPPRVALLLVLPVLLAFVLVVGPRPSVVRAATMAVALILSSFLERRSPPANALGTAAIILLVARPGAICDLGFLLSFGATAGILLLFEPLRKALARPLRRIGRKGGWLADSLALSTSAQCGVAPVLVAQIGELSIVAPIANLAVVPLTAWAVASGFALLAARAAAPRLSDAFAGSAWAATEAMRLVTGAVGSAPWATVTVASRFWPTFLLAVVALSVRLRSRGRRAGRAALALVLGACLTAALASWGPGRRDARVVFFDVGQGDAAFLDLPACGRVLVDAGLPGCGDRVVLPFLRREGVRGLDALVVTHAHADHYGGAAEVLRGVRVGTLVLPPGRSSHPSLASTLAAARESATAVREVAAGDTILAGPEASLVVLGPPSDAGPAAPSENDASVVTRLRIGRRRALLTGDVERTAEALLLTGGRPLNAEVLKVPHHGSGTSTTGRFLDAVSPRVAVVSVGEGNRFGHPSPLVLSRLEAAGAFLFRTDRDGAVIATFGTRLIARSVASGRRVAVQPRRDTVGSTGPTTTTLMAPGSMMDLAASWTSAGPIEANRLAYDPSPSSARP